jgi:tRNA modification GTPase
VEKIGIARAWAEIEAADAVLFLHDLTHRLTAGYIASDEQIAQMLHKKLPPHVPVVDIWNKVDAVGVVGSLEGIALSARTGEGLDALRLKLLAIAGWQSTPEGVYMARERHVQALHRVATHIRSAENHLAARAQSLDLLAEELRLAQSALNEITGEFTTDDLLGVIFSRFCIGK